MSKDKPCSGCGFDGGEFAVEQRSLAEAGRCVACAFDDYMKHALARLRKEVDPAETIAAPEVNPTESKGD